MPGVTTHPRASTTEASGWAASRAEVEPTAVIVSPSMTIDPPTRTWREAFMVTTSPPVMICFMTVPFESDVARLRWGRDEHTCEPTREPHDLRRLSLGRPRGDVELLRRAVRLDL